MSSAALPPLGGWSRRQLIELADRRTERRGSKVLDLNQEFLLALSEFCMEARWPWRRKTSWLETYVGLINYDLTQSAPYQPTLAPDGVLIQGANINDLQQFAQHGVKLYPSADLNNWCELTPLFDRDQQDAALDATTRGRPSQYFMEPGAWLSMILTPVPNATYRIRIAYWAIPNISPDEAPEAIPLVPAFLQHVLLAKLEARILRYSIGEGSAKYVTANGEYTALVQKYKAWEDFTPGQNRDWIDQSDEAIQSTH